jgi:hypothetical protein
VHHRNASYVIYIFFSYLCSFVSRLLLFYVSILYRLASLRTLPAPERASVVETGAVGQAALLSLPPLLRQRLQPLFLVQDKEGQLQEVPPVLLQPRRRIRSCSSKSKTALCWLKDSTAAPWTSSTRYNIFAYMLKSMFV